MLVVVKLVREKNKGGIVYDIDTYREWKMMKDSRQGESSQEMSQFRFRRQVIKTQTSLFAGRD